MKSYDSNFLTNAEINQLIWNMQIVSHQKIVCSMEEFDKTSFRILEKPLDDLILNALMSGAWTIEELSERYGVVPENVDLIVDALFKDYEVLGIGHLPRRVGRDERIGQRTKIRYSLIPLPIHARIFDPTLGVSLLDWHQDITTRSSELNIVPSTEDILHTYGLEVSDYWEIPQNKTIAYLSSEKLSFIQSAFGPLPILTNTEIYRHIRQTLHEPDEVGYFKFTNSNFEKFTEKYKNLIRQGIGSIPECQFFIVGLHDALSYYSLMQTEEKVEELKHIKDQLFYLIFR